MIYCFSGTGNSQWVTDKLKGLMKDEGNMFGMVFPVYAWGIPKVVKEYIEMHREEIKSAQYVYAVMTCGDDIGYADKILNKTIGKEVDAVFSVHMPNTYVCLPGFDVDDPATVSRKLAEAPARIGEIARGIRSDFTGDDVIPGAMPCLKSSVLRPLFEKLLMSPSHFSSTTDCVGCGLCARACPTANITIADDCRPRWSDNCTLCLACYHSCPHHAVTYTRQTRPKGQYHLPK